MNTKQDIDKIKNVFDINTIYAQYVLDRVDKSNLINDAARIIEEKPKPFVKWVGGKRQLLKEIYENRNHQITCK